MASLDALEYSYGITGGQRDYSLLPGFHACKAWAVTLSLAAHVHRIYLDHTYVEPVVVPHSLGWGVGLSHAPDALMPGATGAAYRRRPIAVRHRYAVVDAALDLPADHRLIPQLLPLPECKGDGHDSGREHGPHHEDWLTGLTGTKVDTIRRLTAF